MNSDKVLIIKSTVPIGTNDKVRNLVNSILRNRDKSNLNFDICSNPEFLKEGCAINDFNSADRIIIGTAAITDQSLVKDAVKAFPKKVSVGLDLYKEYVAIKGWTKVIKEKKAEYYFKKFSDLGVESIIYTDINKDGVLRGPSFKNILKYKNMIDVPLIASGGVSCISDIKKLNTFNIEGVIVGKAIYDNKVKLDEIFNLENNVKN